MISNFMSQVEKHYEEIITLKTTQEEDDTRMILHAWHAAEDGYRSIVTTAEDTDVLVICVYIIVLSHGVTFFHCALIVSIPYAYWSLLTACSCQLVSPCWPFPRRVSPEPHRVGTGCLPPGTQP